MSPISSISSASFQNFPSYFLMDAASVHPRRYAKACDFCYKKKIKCVYREPACELCTKTGQPCKFTRMEKSVTKKPRRGKYLAALEERMMKMESLLEQSKENEPNGNDDPDDDEDSIASSTTMETLPTVCSNNETPPTKPHNGAIPEFQFPPRDEAVRLAQGYFASCNHLFPIFPRQKFLSCMEVNYPPNKQSNPIWWCSVLTVLCYAHRLRAMSDPIQADVENLKACPYIQKLLDMAPKLSYGQPSIESAQVLLGMASILRGTPMPDLVPMLVSVAVRMLQTLDAHKEETPDSPYYADRKDRERTFWVAYILDKDIALTTRKPPVLSELDISRPPLLSHTEDQVGEVRSIDSCFDVNLFRASQALASIQARVWNRTLSPGTSTSPTALQTAQAELNPVLAAWKQELPFKFKSEDLVGRWPKHAIIHIVVLHFRYFHTLVELNKEPPMDKDDMNLLNGNCPVAKSLPSYPHSTALVAVEAARDALDLASLTPRGNFQNVWMFFEFSICAVLTLLVNGIVRPFSEYLREDLRRVDAWLKVIDILATSSERSDLLEKKEFLKHMRGWTLHVVQDHFDGRNSECFDRAAQALLESEKETGHGAESGGVDMPEWDGFHPDLFPLNALYDGHLLADNWHDDGIITWPYFTRQGAT